MTERNVSRAIAYLRPCNQEAIAILGIESNGCYVETVAPPPPPTDIRLDGIPYATPETTFLNSPRESTLAPWLHPQVLRFGFDTKIAHSARGFVFGPAADANVRCLGQADQSREKNHFRIHYNFRSGALMLTSLTNVKVDRTVLKQNQSVLLMAGALITCGRPLLEFEVEFPDITGCTASHERHYREYVEDLGKPDALYLATSHQEERAIGAVHRSKGILGTGGFGQVHKAVNTKTGDLCAIKIFSRTEDEETDLHEVKVMCKLSHPNVIEYRDAFQYDGQLCLVMELAINDLHQHRRTRIGKMHSGIFTMGCIRAIARQALSALEYLHAQGYTHRDLKPQNLLVTGWDMKKDIPTVKLADFGVAGVKSRLSTICGTRGYLAPELEAAIARGRKAARCAAMGFGTNQTLFHYDNSVDIWALGKMLQELVEEVLSTVRGSKSAHTLSKEPAMQLIRNMMQTTPRNRPTASQCLRYPWIVGDDEPTATKRNRLHNHGRRSAPHVNGSLFQASTTREDEERARALRQTSTSGPDARYLHSGSAGNPADTEPVIRLLSRFIAPINISDVRSIKMTDSVRNTLQVSTLCTDGRVTTGYFDPFTTEDTLPPLAGRNVQYSPPFSLQATIKRILETFQVETGGQQADALPYAVESSGSQIRQKFAVSLLFNIQQEEHVVQSAQCAFDYALSTRLPVSAGRLYGEPGPTVRYPGTEHSKVEAGEGGAGAGLGLDMVASPRIPFPDRPSLPNRAQACGISADDIWTPVGEGGGPMVAYPSQYEGLRMLNAESDLMMKTSDLRLSLK